MHWAIRDTAAVQLGAPLLIRLQACIYSGASVQGDDAALLVLGWLWCWDDFDAAGVLR